MRTLLLLAPLTVAALLLASPALAQTTVTVPLELVNIAAQPTDPPVYKLGIWVGLGGGAPQLYEFDTGGQGFFAAQNPNNNAPLPAPNNVDWWPTSSYTVVPTGGSFTATYSSGIVYTARLVSTEVAIFSSGTADASVASVTAQVGQILDATGGETRQINWAGYEAAPVTTPPVWEHFYGDFGANLAPYAGPTSPGPGFFMHAVLPQLPGNLSSGFIISMGGTAAPQPMLQLGLTDADRATFPVQLPMLGPELSPPPPVFPTSGLPTYGFFQVWGYASLTLDGLVQEFPTELIFDTGAPSMTIRTGTNLAIDASFLEGGGTSGLVRKNTAFAFNAGALDFTFSVGPGAAQEAAVAPSVNQQNLFGYINTGLNLFFAYDVMYDVENGVIGFRPAASPTPTPTPAAPPSLRITTRTYTRDRSACTVSGTAGGTSAIQAVTYQRGAKGRAVSANGRENWRFRIELRRGRNPIVIQATNAASLATQRTVVLRRP